MKEFKLLKDLVGQKLDKVVEVTAHDTKQGALLTFGEFYTYATHWWYYDDGGYENEDLEKSESNLKFFLEAGIISEEEAQIELDIFKKKREEFLENQKKENQKYKEEQDRKAQEKLKLIEENNKRFAFTAQSCGLHGWGNTKEEAGADLDKKLFPSKYSKIEQDWVGGFSSLTFGQMYPSDVGFRFGKQVDITFTQNF